jgi:type II secretory pathway component GspD/PulD (secretin)
MAFALDQVLRDTSSRSAAPHPAERIRSVAFDERTSEIVVVGTEPGIADVARLVARLCEPAPAGGARIEVVPLTHVAASRIVEALVTAMAAEPGARIVGDAPTNSVIIEGTSEQRGRLRRAVEALDVP